MKDLLVLVPIPTLYYLKGYDHESEGEAVKIKSPANRYPIPEKAHNKRKNSTFVSYIK